MEEPTPSHNGTSSHAPQNATPLWHKLIMQAVPTVEDRAQEQIAFLKRIANLRRAQKLPPVFAIISGPTLSAPHRMEELAVTLGRVTCSRREADIHIGQNSGISHCHARIEFVSERSCYVVVNLSKNPVFVRLPSGIVQIFSVASANVRRSVTTAHAPLMLESGADLDFAVSNGKPTLPLSPPENEADKQKRAYSKPLKLGVTFVKMCETALQFFGGSATQKEIADYIEKHYPEVTGKSTWRNSVSGTLSQHSMFAAEPIVLETGKKARWLMWRLVPENLRVEKPRPPRATSQAATPASTPAASPVAESPLKGFGEHHQSPVLPQKPKPAHKLESPSYEALEAKKRKAASKERMPLDKVAELEKYYHTDQYPHAEKCHSLSVQLGVTYEKVQNWFSNRRKKEANEARSAGLEPAGLKGYQKRKKGPDTPPFL